MKQISFITFLVFMFVMSIVCSCSKDAEGDEYDDGGNITSLTTLDYTVDGYFDGVLYYQIKSNADNTVEVTKGAASVSVVVIPKHVIINGTTYSIKSIKERAFNENLNLSSLVISNTVKSIGLGAFSGCSNLASVIFGKNVESIDHDAFGDCRITRLEFADEESFSRLMLEHGGLLVYGGDERPILSRTLYIKGKEIKDLVIPDSVSCIGSEAFSGCSGLTSVTIPKSVTRIGDEAFRSCSGLTSVTIPENVTRIDNEAFRDCSGLTSVTIHAVSPPQLGDFWFPDYEGVFDGSDCPIWVASGSVEAYKTLWNNHYANRIQGY